MIYNCSSLLVAEKTLERLLSLSAFHQGEPDMELIEDKATVVGELQLAARAEEFMVHVRMGLRKSGLYIHSIRFKEMFSEGSDVFRLFLSNTGWLEEAWQQGWCRQLQRDVRLANAGGEVW